MCGIAGVAHKNAGSARSPVTAALRVLNHRGPDDSGVYESPYASLGAVRLSIVDVQHGHQPIVFDHPKTVIAFNGEIYNHLALRRELQDLGHTFQSACDTETVLHAFLEWHTDAFRRLVGMFAVAVWDEQTRRLFLARDRLGIKPLYYCAHHSSLYFGSELKALFAYAELDRRVHPQALGDYLSLNYVPGPNTLVEGMKKLPPGSWMEWHAGDCKIVPFWSLGQTAPWQHGPKAAEVELDFLLRRSVREHLMADVPVAVWISGGLDSSTVLHYAAEAATQPVRTYSVTFQGRSFDEANDARLLAAHFGTIHQEIDVNPSLDLVGAIENMVFHSDEPTADAGSIPLWFLSRLTRSHDKVALTGEGADELFAGYQTHAADVLKRRLRHVPSCLLQAGRTLARFLPNSNEKIGFDYKVNRFLAGLQMSGVSAHLHWNGAFTEQEKFLLQPNYTELAADSLLCRNPYPFIGNDWLQQALLLDQAFYLPDNILAKCDRMSMAHSVEVRPPFLDHRVVEFANSLPPSMKLHRGVSKIVLRNLIAGKLPKRLLQKKKEGLDIPVHHWLRTALRELLLDTLTPRAIAETGLFSTKQIRLLIEDHLSYRRNAGYQLWGLLIFFLWRKRWNITCHAGPAVSERVYADLAIGAGS